MLCFWKLFTGNTQVVLLQIVHLIAFHHFHASNFNFSTQCRVYNAIRMPGIIICTMHLLCHRLPILSKTSFTNFRKINDAKSNSIALNFSLMCKYDDTSRHRQINDVYFYVFNTEYTRDLQICTGIFKRFSARTAFIAVMLQHVSKFADTGYNLGNAMSCILGLKYAEHLISQ